MHTYLLIGKDKATRLIEIARRLKSLEISPFDEIAPSIELPSIGISETRQFIKKLSLLPEHGAYRAGIISESERLTMEAQQSLLKTLEEPPAFAYIFLGAPSISQLLPTIVSRCIIIHLIDQPDTFRNEEEDHPRVLISKMLTSSNGEKLGLLQTIGKTKEEHALWIDRAIETLRNETVGAKNNTDILLVQKRELLHRLLLSKRYLTNNVNPLLLIEHAFLTPT